MNIDVTKEELLAIVAVSGYIGGDGEVHHAIESIGNKISKALGMGPFDKVMHYSAERPWQQAARLLNSERRDLGAIYFDKIQKAEPITFATLIINNKG